MNTKKLVNGILGGIVRIKMLVGSRSVENPGELGMAHGTEQDEELEVQKSRTRVYLSRLSSL